MPNCDMCGNDSELFLTSIEGTELSVCKNCAGHGNVIKKVKSQLIEKHKVKIKSEKEILELINPDFNKIIKEKREKLRLTQEDLAKKISEKVSVIHKIETKEFEPNIDLAKKLERFLKVKLIEEYKEEGSNLKITKAEKFTIGDFVKNN